MAGLSSTKEAKEFIVSKIVQEAQIEGIPLTEIERKELYFSETDWTLPDMMKINAEFETGFDQDVYEQKISSLIRSARQRARLEHFNEHKQWSDAINILSKEDHYILVMIRQAGISTRPKDDFAKLLATAFGLVLFLMLIAGLQRWDVDLSREAQAFYMWVAAATTVGFYFILRFVLGRVRTDNLLGAIARKILKPFIGTK